MTETRKYICNRVRLLQDHIERQQIQQNTLRKVFTNSVNLKSLLFGIGCMFFQQMCGIVIMYYLRNLFLHFNSKPNQDHTTLIIIGIVQVSGRAYKLQCNWSFQWQYIFRLTHLNASYRLKIYKKKHTYGQTSHSICLRS